MIFREIIKLQLNLSRLGAMLAVWVSRLNPSVIAPFCIGVLAAPLSIQHPAKVPKKTTECAWALITHVVDQHGVPGRWLQPFPVQTVVTFLGIEPVDVRSLYLSFSL